MNNWTFPSLVYKRPDFEALKQQMNTWAKEVKVAEDYAAVKDVMKKFDACYDDVMTMFTIVSVRHTIDTTDSFYEEENTFLNNSYPEIMPYVLSYKGALAASPFRGEIEAEFGEQLFAQMELEQKSFCEANIPLMQRESALTDEYQKIMATCQIEFEGQTLNLYGIQKYFESEDRKFRQAAFQAYSDFYHGNETRLEEIWEELISVRNEMGRNLGYENFIPVGYMQQGRTDYGMAEVENFRRQVKDYLVPLCEELYKAQAKRIGVDKICAWDEKVIFADGNAHPAGDDDFMVSQAQKMYHLISPETGEFIDCMIEHELMDLKNKPGKASTGYMTVLPSYKVPFVFSCFNGTIFDMQVLSHELGHAFAGYMAMKTQPLSDYYMESTDIAEIHSMSMEQFAYPYIEMFFGEDAEKYRFGHLQEALTFVPFGVCVDEFQHICYANPQLTPKERTMEWRKLEKKYMPWRTYAKEDEFFERGGYWYHKLHIYLYPFYYINYCLTTMGAMEFKKKNAADHEKAWADYMTLCKVGGSMSYLKTLKAANVSVPFEDGAVEKACSYAKEILEEQMKQF